MEEKGKKRKSEEKRRDQVGGFRLWQVNQNTFSFLLLALPIFTRSLWLRRSLTRRRRWYWAPAPPPPPCAALSSSPAAALASPRLHLSTSLPVLYSCWWLLWAHRISYLVKLLAFIFIFYFNERTISELFIFISLKESSQVCSRWWWKTKL